jgi:alpha-tubulin suppressor-like RCC1 family protein
MEALLLRLALVLVPALAGCGRIGFDGRAGDAPPAPACTPAVAITALHSGERYACAQLADGSLGCWGAGAQGQLGTGAPEASPVLVSPSGLGAVTAFATGATHACAVKAGVVWCWGSNRTGELGQGNTMPSTAPVSVPGLPAIVAVAAGGMNTCAIDGTGQLYCWGQVDGIALNTSTQPRHVVGLPAVRMAALSSARDISSSEHGCAVGVDGTVWCWGHGDDGELGNNSVANSATPVQAMMPVAATSVVTGTAFTCALASGDVYCWGVNDAGQLGTGLQADSSVPVKLALSGVLELSAFAQNACARTATDVYCWGDNAHGELGDAATAAHVRAPLRIDVPPAQAIAVGESRSCALDAVGVLRCWGLQEIDPRAPVASRTGAGFDRIVANGGHACAHAGSDDSIACWGANTLGEVGDGTRTDRNVPIVVEHGGALAVSDKTSCVLHRDATVACWGSNDTNQIDMSTDGVVTPPRTLTLPAPMTALALGGIHTCAIDNTKTVWCWGADSEGELGIANTMPRYPPTQTGFAPSNAIAAGELHTCVIESTGQLQCAGRNNEVQIASGMNDVYAPYAIPGFTPAAQISLGHHHTCALMGTTASCWGEGTSGQLGNGRHDDVGTPTTLPLANVVEVVAGAEHTCARDAGGMVSCWGTNDDGELGDGTRRATATPVTATALAGASQLALGATFTCGLFPDGSAHCIGSRTRGQLGDGTATIDNAPALSPITCP